MKRLLFPLVFLSAVSFCVSCNDEPKGETPGDLPSAPVAQIKSEPVTYKDDTTTLSGTIAYNAADSAKRPGILVVPEWWGVGNYTNHRAEQLAELGYIALAVDMYGNGKVADNPGEAGKMATPFYSNPQMAKQRIEAALNELKKHPQTDTTRLGAIGYCFGGAMVLNAAKLGENFTAVVSFHGGLEGVAPDKDKLKAKILVCHGGSDPFVPQPQVDLFRKQMDSVKADYEFKVYPGATHAFTNPEATENGKKFNLPIAYNAAADSASWADMKAFFEKNLK